jgi:hypothetical protein
MRRHNVHSAMLAMVEGPGAIAAPFPGRVDSLSV